MQSKKSCARLEKHASEYLADLFQKDGPEAAKYSGMEMDILYKSRYRHKHRDQPACICANDRKTNDEDNGTDDKVCDDILASSCNTLKCESEREADRLRSRIPGQRIPPGPSSKAPDPRVHFGNFASRDTVMKSGVDRDDLASQEGIIAFKMESAGVWDSLPTVVVKGVADYADSHKNDDFHKYAAATAACVMKAVLKEWRFIDSSWRAVPGPCT